MPLQGVIRIDYIKLNNKLFYFTNRQFKEFKIGSGIERSLNGTLREDVIATKKAWTFNFELDVEDLIRLKSIFDLHNIFPFVDYDGQSYQVAWDGDFEPQPVDIDIFTIEVKLEEG